jgi:hypothetical protein
MGYEELDRLALSELENLAQLYTQEREESPRPKAGGFLSPILYLVLLSGFFTVTILGS